MKAGMRKIKEEGTTTRTHRKRKRLEMRSKIEIGTENRDQGKRKSQLPRNTGSAR